MRDVVIIGGGPAGCAAALALAQYGRSVLLIEQHRFPRDKVCGECLSSLGIDALQELGIASIVEKLRPAGLVRTILHAQDGSSSELNLPRPMWGISRRALDAALLEIVRQSEVEIRQPVRCEAIESENLPSVWVRDLLDNKREQIHCKIVMIADGKGSALRPPPTRDLGIKTYFENVNGPNDAIELFGLDGHYGGLAPVENRRWNAAFSVPSALAAQFHGDLDALMANAIGDNPVLKERIQNARQIGSWLASPLPRFGVQRQWPNNVIPIGNAAAAVEPIGGEGMGLALQSAILAAGWIDRALENDSRDVGPLRGEFARLWNRRRAACRLMAIMISHPACAQLMMSAASAGSALTGIVLREMGKRQGFPSRTVFNHA